MFSVALSTAVASMSTDSWESSPRQTAACCQDLSVYHVVSSLLSQSLCWCTSWSLTYRLSLSHSLPHTLSVTCSLSSLVICFLTPCSDTIALHTPCVLTYSLINSYSFSYSYSSYSQSCSTYSLFSSFTRSSAPPLLLNLLLLLLHRSLTSCHTSCFTHLFFLLSINI